MKAALVVLALSFTSLALADGKAPDRSGEPVLRQLLKSNGALKTLHCVIREESQESEKVPFLYERSIDFYYGGGSTFRVETASHFDNGYRAICDGKFLISDPLGLPGRARITKRKAGPSLIQTPSLKFQNGAASPLYGVLAGEYLLDKVIPKTTFIKEVTVAAPFKAVRFGIDNLGVVTFYYLPNDKNMLVRMIETDNSPAWRKQMDKDGFAEPGTRLKRQTVYYTSLNTPLDTKTLFDVTPPKGYEIDDQTKAPDPSEDDGGGLDRGTKSEEEIEREKEREKGEGEPGYF